MVNRAFFLLAALTIMIQAVGAEQPVNPNSTIGKDQQGCPFHIELQTCDEYPIPGPMLIVIEFTNSGNQYVAIPSRCDITHSKQQISFKLESVDTGAVIQLERPSLNDFLSFSEHQGIGPRFLPYEKLLPGRSKRMLVELSDFGSVDSLPSGQYQLTVLVFRNWNEEWCSSSPVLISLKNEHADSVDERELEHSWKIEALTQRSVMKEHSRGGMSLDFLLKWADVSISLDCDSHAPDLDPVLIEPRLTLPEELVLAWECYESTEQLAKAERVREEIAKKWPEVLWRLGEVDAYRGFLTRAERLRRAVAFRPMGTMEGR